VSEDTTEYNVPKKEKTLVEALAACHEPFMQAMQTIEDQSESYWNSLSKEQQLDAFCAVVRRLYKGEIELNGSYRYVLYDVFGFGPDAYVSAQMSGYLDLHNSIYTAAEIKDHVIRIFKAKDGNYLDIITELSRILEDENLKKREL
jgi:hypothetical protein